MVIIIIIIIIICRMHSANTLSKHANQSVNEREEERRKYLNLEIERDETTLSGNEFQRDRRRQWKKFLRISVFINGLYNLRE